MRSHRSAHLPPVPPRQLGNSQLRQRMLVFNRRRLGSTSSMGDNAELVDLVLPCEPSAARSVRRALRASRGLGSMLDEVMLVASELVTNAVVHSGCDARDSVSVRVSQSDSAISISVRDPGLSAGEAKIRADGRGEVEGWGLMLVEQLSNRWGTKRNGSYLVWAQLDRAPLSARQPPSSESAVATSTATGRDRPARA